MFVVILAMAPVYPVGGMARFVVSIVCCSCSLLYILHSVSCVFFDHNNALTQFLLLCCYDWVCNNAFRMRYKQCCVMLVGSEWISREV